MQHAAAQVKRSAQLAPVGACEIERIAVEGHLQPTGKRQRDQFGVRVTATLRGEKLHLRVRKVGALAVVDPGDEKIALRARRRRVQSTAHAEITVAYGEQAFHLAFAGEVEAFLLDMPGDLFLPCTKCGLQVSDVQLREVLHDEICSRARERVRIPAAVHPHDQPEAAAPAGLNAGHRVLEDEHAAWRRTERLRRPEEHVGIWLAFEPEIAEIDAVEPRVEERCDAGRLQNFAAMAAGRHDAGLDSACAQRLDERDGGSEGLNAVFAQEQFEKLVLATGQVCFLFLTEGDLARFQEASHAFSARLAVDIRAVFQALVERLVRVALAGAQEFVEQFLPRRGMQAGGARDDAVHVEDCGLEAKNHRNRLMKQRESITCGLIAVKAAASAVGAGGTRFTIALR